MNILSKLKRKLNSRLSVKFQQLMLVVSVIGAAILSWVNSTKTVSHRNDDFEVIFRENRLDEELFFFSFFPFFAVTWLCIFLGIWIKNKYQNL